MQRIPSPELIRFLLYHWPFSQTTLAEIDRELTTLPPETWDSFVRNEIQDDLQTAIEERGASIPVCDFAKPVVLCLFDDGQQGKTTFADLLNHHGLSVFSTDAFVASLRGSWHHELALRELAKKTVPHCVNEFIRHVETDGELAENFLNLFLDAEHGFNFTKPASVIEGYLHNHAIADDEVAVWLTQEIPRRLRNNGYRVWLANRVRG